MIERGEWERRMSSTRSGAGCDVGVRYCESKSSERSGMEFGEGSELEVEFGEGVEEEEKSVG